ncbi:hypothetical protein OG762_32075 [Streptomyces sp. NBC_01136]|uniref:hypothetical protein n=1 Tax=unclassified Streptomyces TaxID=2593676 RepID=UPI00325269BC|nr:hypothetical protein OG762_32075 [Streptomyces sp. NBC_01136]
MTAYRSHPAGDEGAERGQGVVNAFDDEHFAAAVKATGRTNLIIAGVTNDVCTVCPTLTGAGRGGCPLSEGGEDPRRVRGRQPHPGVTGDVV